MKSIIFALFVVSVLSIQPLTEPQLVSTFQGILQGLNINNVNVTSCVMESYSIGVNIGQAVDSLKEKSFSGVKSAFSSIFEAIRQLPEGLSDCQAPSESIESVLQNNNNMKQFWTYPFKFVKNLVENHVDIINKFEIGYNVYKPQNDYQTMGQYIGQALSEVLLLSQPTPSIAYSRILSTSSNVEQDVYSFALGFIGGISTEDSLDNMFTATTCVAGGDIQNLIPQVTGLVNQIKSKNVDEIVTGLINFFKGIETQLQLIPLEMTQCGLQPSTTQKLSIIADVLKNPFKVVETLYENIKSNPKGLILSLESMQSVAEAKNYQQLGYNLGQLLDQLFFGPEQQAQLAQEMASFNIQQDIDTIKQKLSAGVQDAKIAEQYLDNYGSQVIANNKQDVGDFLLGLVGGYFDNSDLTNITQVLICAGVSDFQGLSPVGASLISAIKEKSFSNVIKYAEALIVDLGLAFQNMNNQFQSCDISPSASQKIAQLQSMAKNPITMVKTIVSNVEADKLNLIVNFESLVSQIEAMNFNNAGWQLGQIFDDIFVGDQQIEVTQSLNQFIQVPKVVQTVEGDIKSDVSNAQSDSQAFLLGIIGGLSESSEVQNVASVIPCVGSSGFSNIESEFSSIVSAFKSKQYTQIFSDLYGLIKSFVSTYENLPNQMVQCGLNSEQVSIVSSYLNFFKDPINLAKLVIHNIGNDKTQILMVGQQLIQDYEQKNWQNVGTDFGVLLANLGVGQTIPVNESQ